MEIWKDIPEWEGYYQVSNLGRVKSLSRTVNGKENKPIKRKERVLKPAPIPSGYLSVVLCRFGTRKTELVHALVASAFLGYERRGRELVCDHIDENKLNNNLSNLRVITLRENTARSTSKKLTGAFWHKRLNKWQSSISINNKTIHLGYFDTEIEANEAYKDTKKKLKIL